jgi:hypothetical protein
MISALVTAGADAGYLVNSRLAKVHWQAVARALPAPAVTVAGESGQWVDPQRLAARVQGARTEHESGANPLGLVFPAPSGTHWRSSNFNRKSSSPPI